MSERSRKGKLHFSAKALFSSGVSKEIPRISQFAFVNSEARSRNPWPSVVHPGVSALGYHQRTVHLPDKSESETV